MFSIKTIILAPLLIVYLTQKNKQKPEEYLAASFASIPYVMNVGSILIALAYCFPNAEMLLINDYFQLFLAVAIYLSCEFCVKKPAFLKKVEEMQVYWRREKFKWKLSIFLYALLSAVLLITLVVNFE
ncbi:hypothetical protein [Thalassomonas sp. M1454]|uniref:hypothetical protein n=1 Tax=Thalassomonas sp. M1454 TaxID=2594477 RepID=UPI001180B4FF|nr:hypothetical protein [Thalassomonas sp. M1454]TRX53452.1 hypothetical protein FNN08_14355 [Thalassomonas sp. M1454]